MNKYKLVKNNKKTLIFKKLDTDRSTDEEQYYQEIKITKYKTCISISHRDAYDRYFLPYHHIPKEILRYL